jgi:hypothetical protein
MAVGVPGRCDLALTLPTAPPRKRYQEWRAACWRRRRRRYVEAMLVTNHVLSGAVIGGAVRRPVPAFVLGVASHFVLDATPHWGKWRNRQHFMRVAVRDGLAGLAAIGAFTALAPPDLRLSVLAGMVGAALPDIEKPSRIWFGRSPFPRAVDRFHKLIQREERGRAHYELTMAAVFGTGALVLVRKRR